MQVDEIRPNNKPYLATKNISAFPASQFAAFIYKKLGAESKRVLPLLEQLSLHDYSKASVIAQPERRWEYISAYQKAIRYGHIEIARLSASALLNSTEECATYLWKRIPVVATEDVGLANVPLCAFAMLCAQFFSARPNTYWQSFVAEFLTEQLSASIKDRTLCDLSVIAFWALRKDDNAGLEGLIANLSETEFIYKKSSARKAPELYADHFKLDDPLLSYLVSQNWRTEGMSKFIGPALNIAGTSQWVTSGGADASYIRGAPMLAGLPSYAFDMHTRIGKLSLLKAAKLTSVNPLISYCKEPWRAMGWALFRVESGLLDVRRSYTGRDWLENAAFALALAALGVSVPRIEPLLRSVKESIMDLNEIRRSIIGRAYAS